jgi:protein phosphatase
MGSENLADTADFALAPAVAKARMGIPPEAVDVAVSGLSHRGKVRANNEDCFLVLRFARSLYPVLTNLPNELALPAHQEIGYGLLVADGLGGEAAGEVASRSAIHHLIQLVLKTPDWIFFTDQVDADPVMSRMVERFRDIDQVLKQQGRQFAGCQGMGTTLTLACTLGLGLVICHIGDSRAYLFRQGRLSQLTRDMTVAQDLVDAGDLEPTAKAASRLRHVLTQSLGTGTARADASHHLLRDGDRLLLCSDGLNEMLSDAQIAAVLATIGSPAAACHHLVQQAVDTGGRDNVTAVVADYRVKQEHAASRP